MIFNLPNTQVGIHKLISDVLNRPYYNIIGVIKYNYLVFILVV
jgi:hypothetical protein